MPSSALVAKQVDIRSSDYASSGALVSLKTYDSTSTYDFILPATNPKWLNGVDDGAGGQTAAGQQVADQVLTYDVASDTYVWKDASSSEFFVTGETTEIGSDEMGNVMTIHSEARVQPGEPLYDPSKTAEEQVFKAVSKFTDTLYNISQIAAGKALAGVTYDKTTGMYFDFTDSSVNPGGVMDNQKQAKDRLTLTTKKLADDAASPIAFSQLVLSPDDVRISHHAKVLSTQEVIKSDDMCYPGLASSTASTMRRKPAEFEYEFGADSSKFKVDNAKKSMEMDMSTFEFGESGSKHRLKIHDGKLFIQKYDSGLSKWIGAQVVIDEAVSLIGGSLTIDDATVSGTDCAVTVTLSGTADHWHLQTDDESSSVVMVAAGTLTHTLTGLYPGVHTIVAWPVDSSHAAVGEKVTSTITIA